MRKKNKYRKGSLTAEAALVLPIFLFCVLFFISFFEVLYIQETVQYALSETAKELSRYSYIYDDIINSKEDEVEKYKIKFEDKINKFVTGEICRSVFLKYISLKEMKNSCIEGGISLINSELINDKNEIDIVAFYQVRPKLSLFGGRSLSLVQRVKTKGFIGTYVIGYENEDKINKTIVYMAENGKVYHKDSSCTHLLLSVKMVSIDTLEQYRNKNGRKYIECGNCIKKIEVSDKIVYIATQGFHYHSTRTCSGLKRTVREVELEDIKGILPCHRCGG